MTSPVRAILLGLSCALAFGCGDGGTSASDVDAAVAIDGAVAIDAAPAADADPSCRQWRLVQVPLAAASSLETRPVHPDRSARLLVSALQCPGDVTGPITYAPTLENEFLMVTATVWRSADDCEEPEVVVRPLAVRFLYTGTWTINTNGAPLEVTVVAAPDVACGASAGNCVLDCDCAAGEVCLSGTGLAGAFAACARPCEYDRDCLGDGTCESPDDGLEHVCSAGGDECAEPARPCPDGFSCEGGSCSPLFTLDGSTRHACMCDAECGAGLRCAWAYGAETGRCDALCLTTSDGWCQGPHSCTVTVEPQSQGVCGWVGD